MAPVIMRTSTLLLAGLLACAVAAAQSSSALEWHRAAMLGPRRGHALAYDPFRSRMVMYGGGSPAEYGTWEWDGVSWSLRRTASSPGLRAHYAMAWDPNRRTVLLVGGIDPITSTVFDDTWEFDGREWRLVIARSGFVPRMGHSVATDWGRNRVVMFGGWAWPSQELDDTWEWDGTRWARMQPPTIPDRRYGHDMAYCVLSRRLLMFGGIQYFGPWTPGTWEWDGTDWKNVAPAVQPTYRIRHGLATNPVDGSVVLHGGVDNFANLRDTWKWDGSRWVQLVTPTLPPERNDYAMGTDVVRREVILIGEGQPPNGSDGGDTWAFDGQDWRLAHDLVWPHDQFAFVVHDDVRDEFVALAHRITGSWSRMETYTMNETHWRLRSPSRVPSVRAGCAIGFHAAAGKVVMFGGPFLDDTWIWDGTDWTEQIATTRPPLSNSYPPTMTYDVVRQRIVLFARGTGETWEWDQAGWTRRVLGTNPPPFDGAQVMYDGARRKIVLVGVYGSTYPLSHTWEFDGTGWRQLQPASRPWTGQVGYLHPFGVFQLDKRTGDIWLWNGSDWVKQLLAAPFASLYPHTVAGLAYDPGRQRVRAIVSPSGGDQWYAWDLRFRQLTVDNPYPRGLEPIRFGMDLPALPGRPFVLGLAGSSYPGMPLRTIPGVGTELLPLSPDALLALSLQVPLAGTLDGNGRGSLVLTVPPDAALAGFGFHGAAVAFNNAGGIGAITHPVPIEIMR